MPRKLTRRKSRKVSRKVSRKFTKKVSRKVSRKVSKVSRKVSRKNSLKKRKTRKNYRKKYGGAVRNEEGRGVKRTHDGKPKLGEVKELRESLERFSFSKPEPKRRLTEEEKRSEELTEAELEMIVGLTKELKELRIKYYEIFSSFDKSYTDVKNMLSENTDFFQSFTTEEDTMQVLSAIEKYLGKIEELKEIKESYEAKIQPIDRTDFRLKAASKTELIKPVEEFEREITHMENAVNVQVTSLMTYINLILGKKQQVPLSFDLSTLTDRLENNKSSLEEILAIKRKRSKKK